MDEDENVERSKWWPYESKTQWENAHSPEAEERKERYKKMSFMEQMAYHERKIGIFR